MEQGNSRERGREGGWKGEEESGAGEEGQPCPPGSLGSGAKGQEEFKYD